MPPAPPATDDPCGSSNQHVNRVRIKGDRSHIFFRFPLRFNIEQIYMGLSEGYGSPPRRPPGEYVYTEQSVPLSYPTVLEFLS